MLTFIERTIAHLAPGGSFLFNLGRQNLAARPAIDRIVHQRFASVRLIEYGRCHVPLPFGGAAAARFLSRHPGLCRPTNPNRRLAYYGCLGRL